MKKKLIVAGCFAVALSLVISITELVIISKIYQDSSHKAELHLSYEVYDSGEKSSDGEGQLCFYADEYSQMNDFLGQGMDVTITRPGGEMDFVLENTGDAVAKYVTLSIELENAIFYNDNLAADDGIGSRSGWKLLKPNHAIGGWQELRWESGPDNVLLPEIPIDFPEISFSNSFIATDGAKMHVIIAAENAETKEFTIPMKIAKRS